MTSLNFKSRVPVFDANVRVGDLLDEPAPYRDREGLLAEMDRHGVEQAVSSIMRTLTMSARLKATTTLKRG